MRIECDCGSVAGDGRALQDVIRLTRLRGASTNTFLVLPYLPYLRMKLYDRCGSHIPQDSCIPHATSYTGSYMPHATVGYDLGPCFRGFWGIGALKVCQVLNLLTTRSSPCVTVLREPTRWANNHIVTRRSKDKPIYNKPKTPSYITYFDNLV